MGYAIKRVARTFDWPLDTVWHGYINAFLAVQQPCPMCNGECYSHAGRILNRLWYARIYNPRETADMIASVDRPADRHTDVVVWAMHMLLEPYPWSQNLDVGDVQALVDAGRLWQCTDTSRTPESRGRGGHARATDDTTTRPEFHGSTLTPDVVNAWSRGTGLTHDGINAFICMQSRATRFDVPLYCAACDGEGVVSDADLTARIAAWRPTEPPAGDGWQMWETVSEGAPVTPVFATADALVAHLVDTRHYSPQAARACVEQGQVPTLVGVAGVGLWDGITAAGINAATVNEHRGDSNPH